MYFNGPYLRVLTPKTTNGVIPLTIAGEVQYKESFLPLTAKKQLEKKNARLAKHNFTHLIAIIEVVGEEVKKPNPRPAQQTGELQEGAENVPPAEKPARKNPKPRQKEKPE